MTVRLGMLAVTAAAVAGVGCSAGDAAPRRIPLADAAVRWSGDYTVHAAKTDPTFVTRMTYGRMGDRFALDATSSDGAIGRVVLSVGADGTIAPLACPPGTSCDGLHATGYLATAAVVSAQRRGLLTGSGDVAPFAGREVLCVPAEVLGAHDPPLDPCLDLRTGAVLAHRHRSDGTFAGPTPDPHTVVVAEAADPALFEVVPEGDSRTGAEGFGRTHGRPRQPETTGQVRPGPPFQNKPRTSGGIGCNLATTSFVRLHNQKEILHE